MTIKEFRKKYGITNGWMASQIGISQPLMSQIANGSRQASLDVAFKIERLTKGKVKASSLILSGGE